MKFIFIRMPQGLIVALISVFFGLFSGAFLILLIGSNPLEGFRFLIQGGFMSFERFGNTLATATPLILTGLSVACAFKTGLFNIGSSGQLLLGGLGATLIGLNFALPKPLLLLFMLLVAVMLGAIWGLLPGLLKAFFNVHEVVCTIMMNWFAYWVVYFTIPAYLATDFVSTESRKLSDAASLRVEWLTELFDGSYLNLGIIIAGLGLILIWVLLEKTTLGFEMKAVGFNRNASEFSGMRVKKNIITSMLISGGLAGAGGMVLYCGYALNLQIGVLPTQGFDGIAISLLGKNSPIGVFFAAIFLGALHSGKGFMNAMTEIPTQIGDTIIATIIYFASTSVIIERMLRHFKSRKQAIIKEDSE